MITWQQRASAVSARLRENLIWFPTPLILPFFIVFVLTSYVVLEVNPRIGNHATAPILQTEPEEDSAVWISVVEIEGKIVIRTADQKTFVWPKENFKSEQMGGLIGYLKEVKQKEISAAAMAELVTESQARILISVDEKLVYSQVRPILYSLGEAGINLYGFETRLAEQSVN